MNSYDTFQHQIDPNSKHPAEANDCLIEIISDVWCICLCKLMGHVGEGLTFVHLLGPGSSRVLQSTILPGGVGGVQICSEKQLESQSIA